MRQETFSKQRCSWVAKIQGRIAPIRTEPPPLFTGRPPQGLAVLEGLLFGFRDPHEVEGKSQGLRVSNRAP